MITKLAKISPGFRRFSKSQFLTEGHLNQIVDHFDDQIRLSRTNLSGVGIVCGFEVSSAANVVRIKQGLGVTTDGDLLHLYKSIEGTSDKAIDFDSITYKHYRRYDNLKSDYAPFFYRDGQQLDLFELLPRAIENDTSPLSRLPQNEGYDIQDMVVLVYLEHYERNTNRCSSLSCDGEGIDVVANQRILVVSKADAAYINSFDSTISRPNFGWLYYQLPEVLLPKVIPGIDDFETYNALQKKMIIPFVEGDVVQDLSNGFGILLDHLKAPSLKLEVQDRINQLFDFDENNIPIDVQYRYDLLKDLIITYNEIKSVLLQLTTSICTADQGAFPKHLMLGEVSKDGVCFSCRHSFYKSWVHSTKAGDACNTCFSEDTGEISVCYDIHQEEQKVYAFILRASWQLKNYNPSYRDIKITPSLTRGVLSQKAIPFYSAVDEIMLKLWDFNKSAQGREGSNISYHTDLLDTEEPLKICIDKDFYRIEGHQGKNYKDVIKALKEEKKENAVSFNIVALGVSSEKALEENYTSYYVNNRQGIEHKAGVTPRGTFILVFLENEGDIEENFETNPEEGDSPRRRKKVSKKGSAVLEPVIADFMVPYLYCKEGEIALKLEDDTLCFGADTKPLRFDVTPDDGFVTAQVPKELNGGVVRNDNGDFFFDPNVVSPELIGRPITFEVNNQDTEAVITIHRRPEPIITTTVVYDNPFKTEVTVTYNVSGPFIDEITEYIWDFGDGTSGNQVPDASGNVIRQYANPPAPAPTPTILNPTVEVKTNFCSNTIFIEEIIFEDPIVIELELDRDEICVNPADCDIPIHIALVLDESGSIQGNEIPEIKNGLRAFVDDQEGSNNFITLMNMNDAIGQFEPPSRIIERTNITAATKGQFTQWIDEYRTAGNGVPSGAASWASGMRYINENLGSVPDIVIIIADGSVGEVGELQNQIQNLSANTHIFYYCLSEGAYISPGGNANLLPSLRGLLNREPVLSSPDFSNIDTTDYFSFNDFSQLGQFLNNLKQILDNAIGCIERVNAVVLKPENGQIATIGATSFNGLEIQGRVMTINPKEFDAYGQTIRFSVDGFDTDATLIVGRVSENVRLRSDTITYNNDRSQANVVFIVSGDHLPEAPVLLWDFGDGTPVFEGSELTQEHEYTDLAGLENRMANIKVTITNSICGDITRDIEVPFENVEEEVSFRIPSTLCLDGSGDADTSVPFDVSPTGAKVNAVTRTVGMRVGTNEVTFASSSFTKYNVPISFTVNDQPVSATITVIKKPIINFDFQSGPLETGEIIEVSDGDIIGTEGRILARSVRFTINNLNQFDEDKYKFSWDFGDNSTSEEKNPIHRYRYRGNVQIPVMLVVSDGLCGTEVTNTIRFIVAT